MPWRTNPDDIPIARDDTHMTIIRRAFAAAGLVLALLGLLACLGGVAGTWAVKTRAQGAAAAVFTAGDGALEFIGTRLARVKERVESGRPQINSLAEWARRLQTIEVEADVKAAVESLRRQLDIVASEMTAAQSGLDAIEAVARGVQSAAAAIAAAADDSGAADTGLKGVRAADVAEFAGDLAQAVTRLEALRAKLLEVRENRLLLRDFAVSCLAEAADLDTRLANVSRKIDDLGVRVSNARASSADAGRRVHAWIALGALALAAGLLWFGASQVCMLQRAWLIARSSSP
jgi:hypothetical protein